MAASLEVRLDRIVYSSRRRSYGTILRAHQARISSNATSNPHEELIDRDVVHMPEKWNVLLREVLVNHAWPGRRSHLLSRGSGSR
jgi:hypothetical protein